MWKAARYMLDQTITVERNTPTKDASGFITNSWAAISASTTDIAARRHKPDRKHDLSDGGHDQREGIGEYKWVTDVDCGARPGDRINHGGVYYDIKDVDNRGHEWGMESVVYEMWTRRVA